MDLERHLKWLSHDTILVSLDFVSDFQCAEFQEIERRSLVQGISSGGPATEYSAWLSIPFLF